MTEKASWGEHLIVAPTFADVIAGISVALVLLPQSLAYAEIAGMPPAVGLMAAALPPIIGSLLASSPWLQTGPVALTSLLTFGVLSELATPGTMDYVKLGTLLALVVGITRTLLGLARLGSIAYLMTEPVLVGFTSAAALTIMASQLDSFMGADPASEGVYPRVWDTMIDPGSWNWAAIGLGLLTMAIVAGVRQIHRLIPGVLIAVVVGIVASRLGDFDGEVVGDLPGTLPSLSLSYDWSALGDLLIPALVIALVGFAEPSSIARLFAKESGTRWNADRELLSQGLANLTSSVSGAWPVGGSFSRSSLNRQAGARTRWSGAITGATVLISLPFSTALEPLPKSVLAGIVIGAVYRLFDFRGLWGLWGRSVPQALIAAITFISAILLSPRIDQAVLVGVVLALLARFGFGTDSPHGVLPPIDEEVDELSAIDPDA